MAGLRPRAAFLSVVSPLLLAGLLPLDPSASDCWGWTGAWVYPVGSRYSFGESATPGEPEYQINRTVQHSDQGGVSHQGADLANGRAGGVVRAAAAGLVVAAEDDAGEHGGYGCFIVLAHRETDQTLFYSVYAHLQRGSLRVRAGTGVNAGDPIARVGETGRATTPHLHFEVRRPEDPGVRWEHARILEPMSFVEKRLPRLHADTTWARSYLEWGECAGLIPSDEPGDRELTRADWWRMLARSVSGFEREPDSADSLRDALIEAGVLPDKDAHASGKSSLPWKELVRDLDHVRPLDLKLGDGPLSATSHRAICLAHFAESAPARHTGPLRHRAESPTAAEACVLLADLAGPVKVVAAKASRGAKASKAASREHPKPRAPHRTKSAK